MPYRTTLRADEDIIGIYADGARAFGTVQADRYFAGLIDCFALLARHPLLARERSELNPPARVHFHKSHVIAYLTEPDGILIVRVLAGRQQWEEHFGPHQA
jgi:toxin ParE1/3/4